MAKKTSDYKLITNLLLSLKAKYPTYGIGRHISTATADYGDVWGMTDKEYLFALNKYYAELELDSDNIASADFIDQIVKDGMDLENILKDEDYQDDF